MTDLERVREAISDAKDEMWNGLVEAIDTHLKEDAEREAVYQRGYEIERKLEAELTRLREENAALHLMAQRPDMDLFRENARLREELDLKDGLLNQAKAELAELREQLREAGPAQQALYRSIQVRDQQTHELTRLREENDRLMSGEGGFLVLALEEVRDQRDTLLAALSRYGRHDVECKRWEVGTTRLDDRTCTCGYDAAISEVEGEK